MTCSLPRSRTAVTVVVQDWPFRGCTTIVCTDEFRGQRGGIAEVDGAPVPVVEAVGPPAWERSIQDGVSSENGKNRTPSGAVLKLVVFRFSLASPID